MSPRLVGSGAVALLTLGLAVYGGNQVLRVTQLRRQLDTMERDIVALIEDCKLTWGESSLLHITAKCLFTHACGKRLINVNPCVGIMITALLGPRPPVRKRLMLTREELHFC